MSTVPPEEEIYSEQVDTRTQSPEWLSTITAGILLGTFLTIFSVSLTGLIFVGPLASELPHGITMALVTVSITALSMTLFSKNRGIIAGLQDSPLVVMATSISVITTTLTTAEMAMPTILVLITLTTLLNGLILILMGKFKLGILVRYLPYPVIGGFMAGTGIMLLLGGIGTMIDYSLSAKNLVRLFTGQQVELWLPGVLFGILLFIGTRRIGHSLALPGLLLAEGLLFYLLLILSDSTVQHAADAGLLLGDMNLGGELPFINPTNFFTARWDIIQSQIANMGAVLIITPISLLLNLSGIEMGDRKDMDLNHELQAAGKTNILSALAGGMIGFHSLGTTSLGRNMTDTRTHALGVIAGIMPLLILFFGRPLLFFVPKSILGGLLVFQGITFLYNWLIKKWGSLPAADYGMISIIALTIMATNFMTGIVLGFVVMMFTFVISYSRTDIFYRKLSGAELTSNVLRSSRERKQLVRLGWHTHVLELHGFIFFGTANAILNELQSRLRATLPLQYLVIDFRRVTGVDSSAAFCFTRILYLADSLNFTVILSSQSPQLKQQMLHNGIRPNEKYLRFSSDLDRALSWCEDSLLEPDSGKRAKDSLALPLQLLAQGFKRDQIRLLKAYLQKSTLGAKEILMRQGEASDSIYFVESGQISIYLQTGNQHPVRLQTICIGTMVGEVGYCLNIPRTSTIVADTDTIVYRLTKNAMQAIQREEPLLAESIKNLMLRVIAERLVTANRQLLDSSR
ncbi:MAG: SulP family inorganic anion transporter [Candidatus Electrothrix aestuarii]|uniref:SulP family inorganic anion transporter n=1 Tax=Candidatus Electrothrix aestuarii TaxID=3062594 RepID=A0AAU8M033_9BACT|nr:SulP family inorganic anion transporter [Candidatus Electrothrix aestuarii]